MVTDTDAVVSIARDQGMLAGLAPGARLGADEHDRVVGIEEVAAMVDAERRDVTLIDAPVSGSRDPAEQGALTIFASGVRRGSPARRFPLRRASASARSGSAPSGLDRESRS